mgnify:CR=1 FL=1
MKYRPIQVAFNHRIWPGRYHCPSFVVSCSSTLFNRCFAKTHQNVHPHSPSNRELVGASSICWVTLGIQSCHHRGKSSCARTNRRTQKILPSPIKELLFHTSLFVPQHLGFPDHPVFSNFLYAKRKKNEEAGLDRHP